MSNREDFLIISTMVGVGLTILGIGIGIGFIIWG